MKKIKYILGSAFLTALLFSCDAEKATNDSSGIGSTATYPTPTFTLTGGELSFNEKDEPMFVYDIVLDKPATYNISFGFEQVGGTAVLHEDYDVVEADVEAFTTTAQIMVLIHNDTDLESTETLDLKVSAPSLANAFLLSPSTVFPSLSLTIEDYKFCTWILETSDTYGDGWNGGYVEVTSEGVTTEYSEDDDVPNTFEIVITEGADYSFTYVSGGGTGAGPGWESENYFSLTAPDGTFWEEGSMDYSGIPTEGVITAGINVCP